MATKFREVRNTEQPISWEKNENMPVNINNVFGIESENSVSDKLTI